ncbi:MAG: rhomboid family intramembrane serine protease [Bacteroidales bacterium]|nr:rhomboid family intramembrane serine protease [Bacteroidales bacterium]
MRLLDNLPKVTRNIILTNVIVFVATMLNSGLIYRLFAMYYPASPMFRFWQPLTHMFVHGGFAHIFFNMYALLIFGSVVERIIGEKKFLILYLVSGLGAAAFHMAVMALFGGGTSAPVVGASGAIYGVILTYAMLFPDSRLTLLFPPVTLSARKMVIIFAAIEILTGVFLSGDGIAHFAHLGGMIFAFLLIFYWKKKRTLFDRN